MPAFTIIDVPSNLGLRPSGVEHLPGALRHAGLSDRLRAGSATPVEPAAPYDPVRAVDTGLLNGPALRETSLRITRSVSTTVTSGAVPVVLAGDCSVVLGGVAGLRRARRDSGRLERVGLLFLDGHVDFYQPEASPTGEVADMDLALATGRGPRLLTELDGLGPLLRDEDVVAVGARDGVERDEAGAQDIAATSIRLLELDAVRSRGIDTVAAEAVRLVSRSELSGFWLHLDADVLDDGVMPAVDYRQPGGLTPSELITLLRAASASPALAGVSVAIYNPSLDPHGLAGRLLVDCIAEGLGASG
jgi:arginase